MPAPRRSRTTASALWSAMRPRQWLKNAPVFAALVLTSQLGAPDKTRATFAAFICFCAVSSAVYILNDLVDVREDRLHPQKRHRPIAAGDLDPVLAIVVAAALALLAVAGGFYLRHLVGVVIAAYLVLQVAYSLALKHIVIVEALAIAGGFVLRVLAGGAAVDRPISSFLYLSMIFLALFQAFSKRRHELKILASAAGKHRQSLNDYTTNLLDHFIMVAATSTIVTYSLYAITTPDRPEGVSANMMLLTVPFVLYAVFRYMYLIQIHGQGGTPEDMLLADRPLMLSVVGWGLTLLGILYVLPRLLPGLPTAARLFGLA